MMLIRYLTRVTLFLEDRPLTRYQAHRRPLRIPVCTLADKPVARILLGVWVNCASFPAYRAQRYLVLRPSRPISYDRYNPENHRDFLLTSRRVEHRRLADGICAFNRLPIALRLL